MFDFTIHHIRFTVEATTPIEMGEFKGSALRGAWTGYMRHAYCGAPPNVRTDPMHEAICPVCYLTSRDTGSESRRPFALQPPLSRQPRYEPGERFGFGFTLFGNAHALFPYVMLAVREVGETYGIGRRLGCRRRRAWPLSTAPGVGPRSAPGRVGGDTLPGTGDDGHPADAGRHRREHCATGSKCGGDCIGRRQPRTDPADTPLRLIHQNRLMREFSAVAFFQRLIERTIRPGRTLQPRSESLRPRCIAQRG